VPPTQDFEQAKLFENLFLDKHRMLQILINFVTNAIKFSPKNSQVTLSIENVKTSRASAKKLSKENIMISDGDFFKISFDLTV